MNKKARKKPAIHFSLARSTKSPRPLIELKPAELEKVTGGNGRDLNIFFCW